MLRPLQPFVLLTTALCAQQASAPPVATGADILAETGAEALRERRIGLITNHTGLCSDGRRTIDVLAKADGVQLVCLFSPEHGLAGKLDESGIAHGTDEASGRKVWSLYGETRKPTAAMLQGVDTLVFDIQDIGCRFYTYVSTMKLALETAAAHKLRFAVLDRPNPIGGMAFEGPVLQPGREDFVGCYTMPLRHGLTAGELARMIVGETGLQVDLQVIACRGWQRHDHFERTGLPWTNPSPNMRNVTQALLYPGVGLLEGTNLSVGRGTDQPFENLGAPWCDGRALAAALRQRDLPGLAFVPIRFTPTASKFANEACSGIHIVVTDRARVQPVALGIVIACELRDRFPAWKHEKLDWLLKDRSTYDAFVAGADAAALQSRWQKDLDLWRMRRKPFLLYD
ncbi:MAG: DUF1343 domain-containing protein [Planctomycetes bacterium]|nr:DUF1343 domain-containing protein [Planctomycetota bacterium]